MVLVRIASLSVDAVSNQPVVLLRPLEEPEGSPIRLLPIWIGHPEATAILLALQGVDPPRPMTHDLLKNVIGTLDAVVSRVEITRVENGTFYAALVLRTEGHTVVIDARPSDSIALAIRAGCPIFVDDDVFEIAAVEETSKDADNEETVENFKSFLDHVNPSDFQS